MRRIFLSLFLSCLAAAALAAQTPKQHSALYPSSLTARAKANIARYPWAASIAKRIVEEAQPWMAFSDEQLWDQGFGATITRSHMVWSSGFCAACRKPVPMYDWEIDGFARPWKVRCPHCQQVFPKNDFHKFYRSGLDAHGIFDPKRANRSLLFNLDHPDAADPLHTFGVDDGEGFVDAGHRWRFIGAYLLYAQWRQVVLGGISNLGAAYAVTGEPVYAHKAAILLDRLADVFPTFDFGAQGILYERARYGGGVAGYVGYAIDSAYDVRRLTLAYDQIFEAMPADSALVPFLAAQARRYKLDNPKASLADVRRNIEDRILRDALQNPKKLRTNYPGTEVALSLLKTVLAWPANREEVMADIDQIVEQSVAVDGVTGEKGLTGYAIIAPHFVGNFLEQYLRAEPGLLDGLLQRHPKFRQTYRFFTDTWTARQYYPISGDCGSFAVRSPEYAGLPLRHGEAGGPHDTDPPVSMFTFLWRMWKSTGDPLYLQLAHLGNGNGTDGLPYDLYAENPEALVNDVKRVIARDGTLATAPSVNKQEWRLAILRSPRHRDTGAVWLDYDSVPESKIKNHYHYDAMNLGLFAKGLDLLPEFGYPAVQFGDWHTPQALWHRATAAHNTVVVDGKNQFGGDGQSTLWADGDVFRVVRASSPGQIHGKEYERTVAMIDTGASDFYVVDVFRVNGGTDHAKFTHSSFGSISTAGLSLQPGPDYGNGALLRNFRGDPNPAPGWSVDWKIEDRYGYLAPGANVHLRYTDLTAGAQAYTCESWTVKNATSTEEFWIPTVMVRRQSKQGPLESTFVSVLEPYQNKPLIQSIQRLPLEGPAGDLLVAIQVQLADGRRDLITLTDSVTFTRWDAAGKIETKANVRH